MSRAGAAFAGAFVLLGATLLLVTRGPQSAEPTELYFDYDAPDETFAKSLNLDPDSLQKGDTGHTLDEEIGIIQTMIKKATVMNGRLKKRAVKAAPVSINVKAGQKGPPGGRGPRGYRGPRGRTGSAGRPGARGSPGRQGPPGIKGPRGTVGAIGHRGAMGPRGPRGKQGDPGRPGRPGRDGRQGPNGRPGPDGRPGAPGHNGRPGPPGAPAAAGLPGPRGTRGPPGPPGARGPPGVIGRPGATGHTGPRGNNGRPGTAGAVGARGVAGHPRWTLAAKFRVNNNEWQYDSAWWTNRNVYRANDRSDNKNVKTSAFVNKRLTAIKIEMNLRTYIFEMKTRYAGHWTLRDLVSRRQGYQFREPRWKASRLDAFGIAGEKDPSTPNLWYCNNMAAHYTPYYQASIDSRSKCGAVSRFGALLSNSAACAVTNRARPVVAEGVGLKYTCNNRKLSSGRLDGARGRAYFVPATIWVM